MEVAGFWIGVGIALGCWFLGEKLKDAIEYWVDHAR